VLKRATGDTLEKEKNLKGIKGGGEEGGGGGRRSKVVGTTAPTLKPINKKKREGNLPAQRKLHQGFKGGLLGGKRLGPGGGWCAKQEHWPRNENWARGKPSGKKTLGKNCGFENGRGPGCVLEEKIPRPTQSGKFVGGLEQAGGSHLKPERKKRKKKREVSN